MTQQIRAWKGVAAKSGTFGAIVALVIEAR